MTFEAKKPKKTVKMHPVVGIFVMIVLPITMVGIFLFVLFNRPTIEKVPEGPPPKSGNEEYAEFKDKLPKALEVYRQAMLLSRDDEKQEEFREKIEFAIEHFGDLIDELNVIVKDVRDPSTGQLPPEYSAYESDYDMLQTRLEDLVKASPF